MNDAFICVQFDSNSLTSHSFFYLIPCAAELVTYLLVIVKSRPVLHHCGVIFFWSSGIMECTCMLFMDHGVYVVYIWKWSSAHALGAVSGVFHSLLLMNSFNKTEAAVFSCRLCFLKPFFFISLIIYVSLF